MKVLLLNPPYPVPCVRDNYCSYSSKAGDLWSPIDLTVQSGLLSREHEVRVIDAVAAGLDAEQVLAEAGEWAPDAIVALTGKLSWELDAPLFQRLTRRLPKLRLILSADFLVTEARETLDRHPAISAVLVDYTTPALSRWLAGGAPSGPGLIVGPLHGGSPPTGECATGRATFEYPVPRHELFPLERYRLSVARSSRFATVITSRGCNFHCPFCIDSVIAISYRTIPNVLAELDWLAARDYREIYFYDPNFTAWPPRVFELTAAIRERRYGLSFVCNGQVACMRPGIEDALASAGCHTVMFGLESGDDGMLGRNRKGFTSEQSRDVVRRCKAAGLQVLGYFLLGSPGETPDSVKRTVDFALSLPLDFASFNVFSPIAGTALGEPFISADLARCDGRDRSASPSETHCLMPAELLAGARRNAIMRFYGRPSYMLRRFQSIRSLSDLRRIAGAAKRLAGNLRA